LLSLILEDLYKLLLSFGSVNMLSMFWHCWMLMGIRKALACKHYCYAVRWLCTPLDHWL